MGRILAAIAVLTIVIVAGSMIYFASSSRHARHVKIIAAAKRYADSLKAQGLPVPASVSLEDLISRRLLTESDVSAFAGTKVTVNLSVDATDPEAVLLRARLRNGTEFLTLVDGSTRQEAKPIRLE